ncbi:SDR family NAD(P)-dependent oxidoreductase [Chloroflexota bacterium]
MPQTSGQEQTQCNREMTDKIIIVTGGASGFGREAALLFTKAGGKVIIWDIDEKKGNEVVSLMKENGGEARFSRVDVSSGEDVKKGAAEVEKLYGKVDILVNNAGTHQYTIGTIVEISEEDYDRVMDTNTKSVFLCSKYVIPLMRKAGGGAIVNVASAWGHFASNKVPIYCTSKAAVEHITRVMALDFANDKIRVNCVCPGTCRTPLVEKLVNTNHLKFGFNKPEEMWESRVESHPLGRLGTPRDIANLMIFLASEDSSWMTGSVITIDGGYTAGRSFIGKPKKAA